MCGRFTLTIDAYDLQERLDLGDISKDMKPRYNIAPGETVAVVNDALTRDVQYMYWGLVPYWAKEKSIGYRMINARSETLSEKPAFRKSFATRRCLILADGFFEWKRDEDKKQQPIPHYIKMADTQPFTFAGIWDCWKTPEGMDYLSCSIITCRANTFMHPIHDRMPVILEKKVMETWINPNTPINELHKLMAPLEENKLVAFPVSRVVNRPGHNSPDCIAPVSD